LVSGGDIGHIVQAVSTCRNPTALVFGLFFLTAPACSRTAEPAEPPPAVLQGTVTDADTGMPLERVTVAVKLVRLADGTSAGQAVTSSSGAYRITQLDANLEHVVVARLDSFDGATATLTLREGDNVQDLTLRRTRVCNPGSKRCTLPPVAPAVLTCNASGTAYDSVACASGEECSLATNSCGRTSELTVEVLEAGGTGRVDSTPPGIVCPPDCSEVFPAGTRVTLTALPTGEARLARWEGACTGTGECAVTTAGMQTVRARFEGTGPSVTVQKMGRGTGNVTSSPAGVDCGGMCTSRFPTDTRVTLAVAPTARSVFVAWAGCEPTNQPRCQLTAAQGALATVTLDAFYERPLSAEAGCLLLLNFEGTPPTAQGCGGGMPAVVTGTATYVPSRHPTLRNAYEAVGPGEEGWIETLKPGLTTGRRTVEMTIYRVGPAFEGRTRGTLYSDRATRTSPGVELVVHDDGRLVGTTRDDQGMETQVASMPNAIPEGQWRHVELLADSMRGLRLKVDAMLVGEAMGEPLWTATASTAWIGAARDDDGGAIDRFNGRIDSVRAGNYGRD
jgi:hypothetical protein